MFKPLPKNSIGYHIRQNVLANRPQSKTNSNTSNKMPPKEAKKPKPAKEVPRTPEKPKAKPKAKEETPKKVVKAKDETPKKTPAKKKGDLKLDTLGFLPLQTDTTGVAVPVEVKASGESLVADLYEKSKKHCKVLQMRSDDTFTLIKTMILTDGPYAGHQAILLRPAKAMELMKFPEEVRNRIYRHYFACQAIQNEEVVLDGKRKETKEAYAKTYADKQKDRVALLRVNKEVSNEALGIFYAQPIKFESTASVIDFIGLVSKDILPRLRLVEIVNYKSQSARNAMHFLAEAKNLTRLTIRSGVYSDGDPVKAAKSFHGDTYKFLTAVGAAKGDKTAGVDILHFATGALTYRDANKATKNWSEEMVEEFKENLKKKLNPKPIPIGNFTYFTSPEVLDGVKSSADAAALIEAKAEALIDTT
ncbi:hypothetical protein DOTSEDRAFT_24207 [Dothistroma septosporum NZE10]|uniref:Uncharacterized protein n=1 Tax=Dothistroma septosporum (strain NZE10 / CBS 128990) TaxID=675120 RepID=N1PP24_DOTSN|nr:hypothetical protein DOTSEDRAFT_24207 [Dothistroma septosporum NZE10]